MNRHPAHPSRRTFLGHAAALAACGLAGGRLLHAQATTSPSPMLSRTIHSSGESIPVIGMGTWQTFDPPNLDAASLAPLEEVMKVFFDAGGRIVDSSPMYGKSEEVTGILAERLKLTERLFLATKVWTEGQAAGVRQMEQSLKLLKRDRIELMQIHNLVDWQTHLKTLREWKDAGRIKYIGITHYTRSAFDALDKIIRDEKIDFVQLPYSIAVREAEQRLLPAAKDRGVAVLVNRPFEGGDLFASVRDKPLPDFIRPFAGTWAQAFLKYLLADDAVTCVIPATSKPQHMRDNVLSGSGELPDADARRRLVDLLQ